MALLRRPRRGGSPSRRAPHAAPGHDRAAGGGERHGQIARFRRPRSPSRRSPRGPAAIERREAATVAGQIVASRTPRGARRRSSGGKRRPVAGLSPRPPAGKTRQRCALAADELPAVGTRRTPWFAVRAHSARHPASGGKWRPSRARRIGPLVLVALGGIQEVMAEA